MPELPEVETVARTIRPLLVGATIADVEVLDPLVIRMPDVAAFVDGVLGSRVLSVVRRGKHLILELDNRRSLMVHLGMTGRLTVGGADAIPDHARLRFSLSTGEALWYADLRKFGRLCIAEDASRYLGDLGPEPLGNELTLGTLLKAIKGRRRPIKSLLLDQTVLAGLGNIYADEALFEAGIHPCTPSGSLTEADAARLLAAVRNVLTQGIANHGTTISDYVDAQGRAGQNQHLLRAYGRAGRPCVRCGTAMERLRLAGRSACYCPVCQPAPETI